VRHIIIASLSMIRLSANAGNGGKQFSGENCARITVISLKAIGAGRGGEGRGEIRYVRVHAIRSDSMNSLIP